jgi:hypothetical protein
VRTQRQYVDYALAKRAVLYELFSGTASTMDVCDAHPYLIRAAKYHGEPTEEMCPVCRREALTHVTYAYADELKESSGAARSASDLAAMEKAFRDVHVYVVEVCRTCGWNHLNNSYVIGTGMPKPVRAARSAR